VAVDERPGGQGEDEERQALREADDPRDRGRPGQRQREQRERDAGDARPDRRGDLAREEDAEVAQGG
jgi:hypothetical protein